ncbi:hypothetical protein EBF03_08350 [Arcanobacterium haemolyticum]|uniref:CobQ/CobB/MinD/ParA nucleotide binding domain-containing protein n=1 Tax=Arcanobacterium haemolyticum (strain ATCC 9345 / DSM 20595 / CCM 5947 / CCUG 17215 / LMG 16163 / NBRC 15585 / NCTC 8452 / 11018) TaxID=644284 RepID=D7BL69_ARCHD|nr:hypothetical protein [Arcanobacterium haemolyticum]ADH93399.1 hypothetical protein Arch_1717 [Arcanobacterium haemolyticum DSM 20595]QCX47398.1 hypothetical protein EBF03_08350 [Arcanobacterium haemolyticum]SPT76040.1 Flp pilus assembly protein, ATPase CpaE [Arcanobacterium haemolyticum]SQH27685.1 Flp pilus assembly protein, ATPase CpaE [Arcanobacterium haemolyticum]
MRTTTRRATPELELVSVLYRGNDARIEKELRRLSDLVGLDFQAVSRDDRSVDGVLRFHSDGLDPYEVEASFHAMFAPFFAAGVARFHVRDEAADVMALMSAVGVTVRGNIVGVFGAHGGAGATMVAAWLARLVDSGPVALVDLNVCSESWEARFGLSEDATTRADVGSRRGALLPGKLADSLEEWHGVRMLPAGRDGGMGVGDWGQRVVTALAQVHAWTFVDMGVLGANVECQREWATWCDVVVVVTHGSTADLHECRGKLAHLQGICEPIVVANEVGSTLEADHAATVLDWRAVFPVRFLRSSQSDSEHGVMPGDRTRCRTAKDMTRLWHVIRETVE